MIETQDQAQVRDGSRDFDFFVGTWRSCQRRLRERLKGSHAWEEFEGTTVARMVLDGRGNMDEVTLERASGRAMGLTLRLYDPTTRQWNLYWADSVNSVSGPLTPVIGRFENGRGEFYAHEPFEGRNIFVRFTWSDITPTSAHWEQAFSEDGGRTWETNWTADFTRVA
jgi:hypothetical protein